MMSQTKRIVTAVNLSTQVEMTFMNVTPAHAVCYAEYEERGELKSFLQRTHQGDNWDKEVSFGKYTVVRGNWCALSTAIARKR